MKFAMGVPEENDIDVSGPPLAFNPGIVMMYAVLIPVNDQESRIIRFKKTHPLTVASTGNINVPAHSHDRNPGRDLDVEEVTGTITAVNENIKGRLPGEYP